MLKSLYIYTTFDLPANHHPNGAVRRLSRVVSSRHSKSKETSYLLNTNKSSTFHTTNNPNTPHVSLLYIHITCHKSFHTYKYCCFFGKSKSPYRSRASSSSRLAMKCRIYRPLKHRARAPDN